MAKQPSSSGEASATTPPPQAPTEDSDDRPSVLGAYIRAQRQLADLSLRQLATLSNVSNAYLSQVERGLTLMSRDRRKSALLSIALQEVGDIGVGGGKQNGFSHMRLS